MQKKKNEAMKDIAHYYSSKLAQHGETARGVDWDGEASQVLRFQQLSKIIQRQQHFSVNDVGCGYGAFFDYLSNRFDSFTYFGTDICEEMIRAASRRYKKNSGVHFGVCCEPNLAADYSIASGIFNVRLNRTDGDWHSYLESTLELLNRTSRRGFAFNCLTSYSDADKMREDLFYANPCTWFDRCKHLYSRNVALLHDYNLYEFTILVRKQV